MAMMTFFAVIVPPEVVTIHVSGYSVDGEMDVAGVWVCRLRPEVTARERRCMKSL